MKPQQLRQMREISLQFLYRFQIDQELKNEDAEDLEQKFDEFLGHNQISPSSEVKALAFQIIAGTVSNYENLEKKIESCLKTWKTSRLSKIDYTILLQSVFEYNWKKTPKKVIINESLELAKKYSSQESASFINGVLDKILE